MSDPIFHFPLNAHLTTAAPVDTIYAYWWDNLVGSRMRMGMINRWVSVLVAAGYLLAVSTASLFHHHTNRDNGGCCHGQSFARGASASDHHCESGDHSPRPNTPSAPAPCPSDNSHCPVCQFLAQKPAPTAEVVPVTTGVLVQEAFSPPPARIAVVVFSAWHSRGPPAFA